MALKVDGGEVLDSGTSVVGGGIGFNQIFNAVDALMTDGATMSEWGMLGMALWVLVTSFFAFRRAKIAAAPVGGTPGHG